MQESEFLHNKGPVPPADNGEKEKLVGQIDRMEKQLKSYRETINSLHTRLYSQSREGSLSAIQKPEKSTESQASQAEERQRLLIEHDDAVARRLQKSLNPLFMTDFEGIAFSPESRPGTRVGGDFYDIIKISDQKLAMIIADVSGHGLPAAVIMTTARMAFRTFATTEYSAKSILEKSNQTLLESTLSGHHLTAFLGILDTQLLTFQYTNASHCPPCLIRNGEIEELDTDGLFVGMFDEPQYEQKSIQLDREDKLFLYTDGLLRLFESSNREKAISRLKSVLEENSDLHISELTQQIASRLEERHEDDMLILGAQLMRGKSNKKSLRISSIPTEISRVEDTLLPVLLAKGYGERVIFGIKLAFEEALINAIKHGNKLDSTKSIFVDFEIDSQKIVISIEDAGAGFNPDEVPDPLHPERIQADSGRGLFLIKAYMDKVEFNDKGNKIILTKFAPWAKTFQPEKTEKWETEKDEG